jgi:hypothetical protein
MTFKNVLQFFSDGHTSIENFSEDDLRKYGLLGENSHGSVFNRSLEQKKVVEKSVEQLHEMEKNGYILESPFYGKVAVDINGKVPGGSWAAKSIGCGAYIKWNPSNAGFFINVMGKPFQDDFQLREGVKIRKRMYVKQLRKLKSFENNLKLGEVLNKFGINTADLKGDLKKFIQEEKSQNFFKKRNNYNSK